MGNEPHNGMPSDGHDAPGHDQVDTGTLAECPPDERDAVDGLEGTTAMAGGDDSEAAQAAIENPGEPASHGSAVRPYPFEPYQPARNCTGGPAAGTGALLAWLQTTQAPPGSSLGIYNCRNVRGSSTKSLHGEGRALDWGVPVGTGPTGTVLGHDLVDMLGTHAHIIGIQCIIYDRTIWSRVSPNGRPYTGASPHFDHLHIELTRAAAGNLTLTTVTDTLGNGAPDADGSSPGTGTPPRTLRLGVKGSAVRAAQELLTLHGFDPGPCDGVFGANTDAAVRAFQGVGGLEVDGIVGRRTWDALGATADGVDVADLPPRPKVRRGDRGPAVLELQDRLADRGFDPHGSDGVFGFLTEAAVRAFQGAHSLEVDGIVGPTTWAALDGASGTRSGEATANEEQA